MTYRGRIRNGQVVLDDAVCLSEGTAVLVAPVEAAQRPSLAERFQDVIATVSDLPSDMAEQHDHYVHETPRK